VPNYAFRRVFRKTGLPGGKVGIRVFWVAQVNAGHFYHFAFTGWQHIKQLPLFSCTFSHSFSRSFNSACFNKLAQPSPTE
jgi:hypothetical protein